MSGSEATSSTEKPGGRVIFFIASAGDSGGPGGLSCACGITSAAIPTSSVLAIANGTASAKNRMRVMRHICKGLFGRLNTAVDGGLES